jgi:GNAT superfamily N-acetyltransferase
VPDLSIRPAAVRDLDDLRPLVADALEQLRSLRGGASLLVTLGVPEDVSAEVLVSALCGAALLDTDTVVAVIDAAIAGFAVVVRTDRGVDLVGIHTARPLRRRKVGTALLTAARSIATTEDARFEALALPGDQTVKSLLESAGFKARLLRMSAER